MKYICLYTNSLSDNYGVSSPKYNEICTVISKLKSNKAGGADNIIDDKKEKGRRRNLETGTV
jgi:hypothetical protein